MWRPLTDFLLRLTSPQSCSMHLVFAPCLIEPLQYVCRRFWEGGGSLLAQAGGGKSEHQRARCRVTPVWPEIHVGGESRGSSTDSATENKPPYGAINAVRVKRCGKSAPLEAQATRHGKPHRVQGQIGNLAAARRTSAKADGFRVLAAETNDSLRRKAKTKFGLQPSQNHFSIWRDQLRESQTSPP